MNILYEFEHRLLPTWSYRSDQFYNDLINIGEKKTLYTAAKNVYDSQKMEFPFTEEDFGGFHVRLDVDTVVALLRLPQPQETPLCYCAFIYMDVNTNRIAYYTLEKGTDPVDGRDMQFLCGWDSEGNHKQYHNFHTDNFRLGDLFLIRYFYAVFRDLKGIKLPDEFKEEKENTRVLKCPACQKEIIFDGSDINEGDRILVLCDYCLRIYQLKYENGEFLIENKIQEDKAQG